MTKRANIALALKRKRLNGIIGFDWVQHQWKRDKMVCLLNAWYDGVIFFFVNYSLRQYSLEFFYWHHYSFWKDSFKNVHNLIPLKFVQISINKQCIVIHEADFVMQKMKRNGTERSGTERYQTMNGFLICHDEWWK